MPKSINSLSPKLLYPLTVLITVLIAAAGAYFVEHHQAANSEAQLNSHITSLSGHLSTLNSQIAILKRSSNQACSTSKLSASLIKGEGAAGTYYYDLQIKNLGEQPCLFRGVPALFAVESNGNLVGGSVPNAVANLSLAANQSIYSSVGFPNPNNFQTQMCTSNITVLAFYPPGEIAPLNISTSGINGASSYCSEFSMAAFSTKPTGM